jgi:NAD(P)-dependent dehydrogenase (short-subunit alcohol dehydrogenase family)
LDRNTEAARWVVDQAGATTIAVTVDVADRASVTAAITEVFETFGRVDVCINTAGIPNPGKVFGNLYSPRRSRTVAALLRLLVARDLRRRLFHGVHNNRTGVSP